MPGLFVRAKPLAVFILAYILIGCASEPISDFSAGVTVRTGSQSIAGWLYVTRDYYRLDFDEAGCSRSVIVDRADSLVRILSPENRKYRELTGNDPEALISDPFLILAHTACRGEQYTCGSDRVAGYDCDRMAVVRDGQALMTWWYSGELDFPLKIILHAAGNKTVELSDIDQGPLPDYLFVLPDKYTPFPEVGETVPTPPEWAAMIALAPILKPPFSHRMSTGNIIRIKPIPGQTIKLRAIRQVGDEVIARAIPFRDGRPIRDIAMVDNFARRGTVCCWRRECPMEADEIVVRVFSGRATVEAKTIPALEKILAAGQEFLVPLGGVRDIETRFINAGEGRTSCLVSFIKNGLDISGTPIGRRTMNLDRSKKSRRVAWHNRDADHLQVRVTSGTMYVKAGQFDPFRW